MALCVQVMASVRPILHRFSFLVAWSQMRCLPLFFELPSSIGLKNWSSIAVNIYNILGLASTIRKSVRYPKIFGDFFN
jgi:hypothetical protein